MATKRTKNGRTWYEDVVYLDPIIGPDGAIVTDSRGKPRYHRLWVRGRTKRECAQAKADAIRERDAARAPSDPSVIEEKRRQPLSELYKLVKRRHVDHLRPKTQAMWRVAMRKRIAPHFFHVPICDITTEMIDDWIADLKAQTVTDHLGRVVIDPKTGTPKRLHGNTAINRARTCLVTTLNLGKKWNYVGERNAAEHATRLPEDTHVPDIYQPDQVLQMVIASWQLRMSQVGTRGHASRSVLEYRAARDATMIWVKAFSGMRIAEMLALRWRDVTDRQYFVRHQQDYTQVDHLGPVKSKNGFRVTPMTNEMRLALDEWRSIARFTGPDDFVFSGDPDTTSAAGRAALARRRGRPVVQRKNTTSTMLDVSGWRARCFNPIVAHAGFPEAKPHALRHTFITLCKDHLIPAKDVAEWVGDTEEVVNRVYTRASGAVPIDAFDRMSAAMWS